MTPRGSEEISGIGRGRRLLFRRFLSGSPARTACTSTSTVSPGGLDELVTRLEKLGQPA
jgi:hypothetical protein